MWFFHLTLDPVGCPDICWKAYTLLEYSKIQQVCNTWWHNVKILYDLCVYIHLFSLNQNDSVEWYLFILWCNLLWYLWLAHVHIAKSLQKVLFWLCHLGPVFRNIINCVNNIIERWSQHMFVISYLITRVRNDSTLH